MTQVHLWALRRGRLPTPISLSRLVPGSDVAYAALRDIVFNVTTAPGVPVNGLGQFDSKTQNFEFATGWWDYWLHPTFTAEKLRQRLEVAGGDEDNYNDFAAGTAHLQRMSRSRSVGVSTKSR